jgi:nucleotide-binding universal stress UspA family protein
LGAELVTLHVVETLTPAQETLLERYSGEGTVDQIVEDHERLAQERIEKRISRFISEVVGIDSSPEVTSRVVVSEGRVRREILRHVEEQEADLVVMGAHAESTLVDGLLGNTAQRVAQACPVPVLLVQVPEGRQDLTMADL